MTGAPPNLRAARELYSLFKPGNLFILHQRERAVTRCLRHAGICGSSVENLRILEVGCGWGGLLPLLNYYGASPQLMQGIDLDKMRIREARTRHSSIQFTVGDVTRLPVASHSYDLVVQSTLLTSILDRTSRRSAAAEMQRVLRPRGFILWFDFRYNNPRNNRVRGITRREIERDLFPGASTYFVSTVLIPPLARRVAPVSWLLAEALSLIPPLRSHYCAVIRPPSDS